MKKQLPPPRFKTVPVRDAIGNEVYDGLVQDRFQAIVGV